MNLQRIWEVGRGVGRLISDRLSYKNHYMCSGEATSLFNSSSLVFCKFFIPESAPHHKIFEINHVKISSFESLCCKLEVFDCLNSFQKTNFEYYVHRIV